MAADLLDLRLGIGSVLPAAGDEHLPALNDFNTVSTDVSLSEVQTFFQNVAPDGFERSVSAPFVPTVPAEELLRPAVFSGLLHSAAEKLSTQQEPAVQAFVKQDLQPLLENTQLLEAYVGLMTGS